MRIVRTAISKSKMSLNKYITQFKDKKILVIGDIILDKYIQGSVNRISPEAPIQIVEVEHESKVLGGAANVANNICSLGGEVYVAGIVGADQAGEESCVILKNAGIHTQGVIVDVSRQTTTKVRVVAERQQIVRFDYEKTDVISGDLEQKLIEKIETIIPRVEGVILSDYAKGVISKRVVHAVVAQTKQHKIPLLLDPRPKNAHNYDLGVSIFTPNLKEAYALVGQYESVVSVAHVGKELVEKYKADILITQGGEGMTLFEKDGSSYYIPAYTNEVYDIVGAGDTVAAALSLSMAAGASRKEAAEISNYAAGVVVTKMGTATVNLEELAEKIAYGESHIS